MTGTVQKWGNSMAVRLPKAVIEAASIEQGTRVSIEAKEGRIVITPARRPAYRVDDLVRRITRRNRHREIDWGPPRGREVR